MAGKLTWEFVNGHDDEIVIKKKKGKLTVDEIMKFLQQYEQMNRLGEGSLCVIAWRNIADNYNGWDDPDEEQPGDSVIVDVLQDSSRCFCGRVLNVQFCPNCGEKLF